MGLRFSRVHPPGVWDDLEASSPGVRRVPSAKGRDADAAADITTRSFAGTATCAPELLLDWALGEELKGKWDHPDRAKHIGWSMRLATQAALRHGPRRAVFLATAPGASEPGAACTVRFLPGKISASAEGWMYLWEILMRSGSPPFDAKNGMSRRMQAAEDAINAAHAKHAPGPHVNVQLLSLIHI